ncbi:Hop2p KNAG_0D03700 [Huiozyma naganishii CBS 8797]|uniref:Homologous-pairing protein 2 winged helix domain-containing protein n=1 Tax=Huiozyma naganishii (strain ATCC MYA-139 / BCRC 22969 / CBS 8797 / KCTC 17520 / NBRC 10181 / NCYC 3082 / Yp74L-3) TaxID=1071383 RepID=J7S754_HUIN7|nr:hypothetical protein KNAG_0D03700 [Kazachstania naganishii CBS 8797]CCK70116.1 hypothetical protein KNAG_0D03700 [Kazachstania naganishii CBS 8797]
MPVKRKESGVAPEETIEKYLNSQCKPFAVNDIIQNLHGQFGKAAALKALESLTSQDRIVCNVFGKISIYCCKDVLPEGAPATEIDLSKLEEIEQLREKVMELERDRKGLQDTVASFNRSPDNNELPNMVKELEVQFMEEENTLLCLNDSCDPLMEEKIGKLRIAERQLTKDLIARKKILKNLLDILKDQVGPKKLAPLLEDIGVEIAQ